MVSGDDFQRLKVFIEESGDFELAARRLDVRPSTLRKVLAGRRISLPAKFKLGIILGEQITEKQQPNHRFDKLASTIRETIKSQVGFIKYNSKLFHQSDELRLAKVAQKLAGQGVTVVVSNAAHSLIKQQYNGLFYKTELQRHSVIAANPANRSKITELIITNFPLHF